MRRRGKRSAISSTARGARFTGSSPRASESRGERREGIGRPAALKAQHGATVRSRPGARYRSHDHRAVGLRRRAEFQQDARRHDRGFRRLRKLHGTSERSESAADGEQYARVRGDLARGVVSRRRAAGVARGAVRSARPLAHLDRDPVEPRDSGVPRRHGLAAARASAHRRAQHRGDELVALLVCTAADQQRHRYGAGRGDLAHRADVRARGTEPAHDEIARSRRPRA